MSRNAYINKEIPLSKIHEVKADLKRYVEFYEKMRNYDGMKKLYLLKIFMLVKQLNMQQKSAEKQFQQAMHG